MGDTTCDSKKIINLSFDSGMCLSVGTTSLASVGAVGHEIFDDLFSVRCQIS